MKIWNNTKAVFLRELKQMFSRPIYIFSTVLVMGFCFVFFLTFFQEGLPEQLPVGIIDHDESTISRRFIRELKTTQAVDVNHYYNTYADAREAMQKGEIYGFVEIPENMYADIVGNKRPTLPFYVNNAYLIGGTLSYRDFMTLSNLASGAYQREILRAKGMKDDDIMGLIQPILIDAHQIGNPYANYGVYLLNILLPGVLELMILLITIFAIGYELKMKTSRQWLETANGSMIAAMLGKLLPYTILFIILGIASNIVLYDFAGYPFAGYEWKMMIGMILLVLASQAVAVFMIGVFPILREGVCFASLYGVLAFSLAGFTYPIEAMHPCFQGLAQLFPLRHYFIFFVREGMYATGFAGWWQQACFLLAFMILPFMVYKRLEKALIYNDYPLK